MSLGRAVFLDRDGTLIEDVPYLRDPAQVRLLPGAAEAIARLNRAGFRVVVVTNQSGIARGLIGEDEYLLVEHRVDELLAMHGARLDAQYHCPHRPEIDQPCECRKPGPLLYRRASERFRVDLAASFWIGDRLRDVEAAHRFGGRGILVLTGADRGEAEPARAAGWPVVDDLPAAAALVLSGWGA